MGRSTQLRPNLAKIGKEQAECLELRLEGLSFRAIADQTGIPLATVHERVTAAITAEVSPLAEQLRAIECERLDLYLTRLKVRIDKGDTHAIQTALRISERRSKLLGLDMPQRIEANLETHELTKEDVALQELIREAKAKNAETEAALRAGRDEDLP
ncbi:sigma factor-like helix-turn-helix DNA-binding protein [Streptomyces sp. 4N124]|uniref:sigma factor-like helix-turn-helix DNA-binding protein n=1 Tax=Streptomyces sp. 4N124 TaxID=3457420 RepID=UPI003FD261BA